MHISIYACFSWRNSRVRTFCTRSPKFYTRKPSTLHPTPYPQTPCVASRSILGFSGFEVKSVGFEICINYSDSRP